MKNFFTVQLIFLIALYPLDFLFQKVSIASFMISLLLVFCNIILIVHLLFFKKYLGIIFSFSSIVLAFGANFSMSRLFDLADYGKEPYWFESLILTFLIFESIILFVYTATKFSPADNSNKKINNTTSQ